jgi:ATP-binding cassette, subfamily B, bacterial
VIGARDPARAARGVGRGRARLLRGYLRPYRGALAVAVALVLLETAIGLAGPWPLKLAVDNAIGGRPLDGPLAPLDRLGPAGLAAMAALAGVLLVSAGALVGYLTAYLTGAAAERVGADLREAVFGRLLDLALPFHEKHRSGDLLTRLTGDVARVEDSLVATFTTLLPEALTLAGMVVVVLAVDRPLGLAALAVAPVLAVVVVVRRRRIRAAMGAARDADARLASEANEVLRSVRAVQAFGREAEAGRRFQGRSRASLRAALDALDLEARWSPLADLLLAAGSALVLYLGVVGVTSGRITLGTLLVVLAYLSSLYGPIRSLARLAKTLARGAASRERVLDVLASDEVVPQAPAPVRPGPPRRGITLRGVWFAYAEGAPVLRHLDLDVAAAERVCLVGPTGTGKSTLLGLLLRFYDPTAGRIELDGVDLRDLDLAELRGQLALVPQDPWLYHASVAENIAFGRPAATAAEVRRAARVALVDEFVERLPDGWDTLVGEGGARLSGGQRRRVALARAVLRDAPVLLLDEPTSGLDVAAERAVLQALDRAASGRTVLTVSHRLGLAAAADRVVVLDGGRVVEQGPPGELLAGGGAFARLWALQRPEMTREGVS